jgi:hypothetical protein
MLVALLALVLALAWIGVPRLLVRNQRQTPQDAPAQVRDQLQNLRDAALASQDEFQNPKDGSVLVRVPAGAFLMGSQDGEADSYNDEKPAHEVYLDRYWIGKFEVTNEQFERFVAETGYRTTAEVKGFAWVWDGSEFVDQPGASWRTMQERWGPQAPVVSVSWLDARAYCEWAGACLRRRSGRRRRGGRMVGSILWGTSGIQAGPGVTRPVAVGPIRWVSFRRAPRRMVAWIWRGTCGSGARTGMGTILRAR